MIHNEPYFMTNDAWYYYDEDELMYKLTENAPPKAQESYTEFYDNVERIEDDEIVNA